MTEDIKQDVVAPRELIAPYYPNVAAAGTQHTDQSAISGALLVSGAKLYFHNGTTFALVTSA